MEVTSIYTDLNKQVTGYMLNATLDSGNRELIRVLQQQCIDAFGTVIYPLELSALHITLMDWVAPLVEYGQDKDALFISLLPQYDSVFRQLTDGLGPIRVVFDTISVSSGAIFLIGHDNGQFQAIRDDFTRRIHLISGTKQPPLIIHTSIMRFTEQIDIKLIQYFASKLSLNFTQDVNEFRLVNEKKIPMLEYDLVKTYTLKQ